MSSKSGIRICVEVDGNLKRLFSISERKNNDLVINLKSAEYIREPNNTSLEDRSIVNQKYSVHCSDKSRSNINVIKHHLQLSDGEDLVTRNVTEAIKQTNNYAMLYAARVKDLSLPKYTVDISEREVCLLTPYSSSKASLFYMVCVCNYETQMIEENNSFSHKYINYKTFRILILWSFINIPSHNSGLLSHCMTIPPEYIKPSEQHLIKKTLQGFNRSEIIKLYHETLSRHKKELITLLNKIYPISNESLKLLEVVPLTKSPIYPKQKILL